MLVSIVMHSTARHHTLMLLMLLLLLKWLLTFASSGAVRRLLRVGS
jgi:hypothetical protein